MDMWNGTLRTDCFTVSILRKEGLYLTDALRQWEKVYPTWPFPFPPKRMVPKWTSFDTIMQFISTSIRLLVQTQVCSIGNPPNIIRFFWTVYRLCRLHFDSIIQYSPAEQHTKNIASWTPIWVLILTEHEAISQMQFPTISNQKHRSSQTKSCSSLHGTWG